MFIAYKNPNPPSISAFAVSKVETYPPNNDRTYYAVFADRSNYFTVTSGRRFSMAQFLGGTN